MVLNKLMKVGDRAKISIDGVFHNTIISDIVDEQSFYITDIWYMQRKVQLIEGNMHPIICVTQDGLIMFDIEVEGYSVQGNLTLVKVVTASEPTVTQRRQNYRTKVMLDVRVTEIIVIHSDGAPASYNTLTVDISESGMQILTDRVYHTGDKLLCSVDINKFGITSDRVEVVAEVLHLKPPEYSGGKYRAGLKFMKLPESVRSKLARFIIASQVRKQNR